MTGRDPINQFVRRFLFRNPEAIRGDPVLLPICLLTASVPIAS